jgi:hypothetical protein
VESRARARIATAVVASAIALAGGVHGARADSSSAVQRGVFALLGGRPGIVSYAKSTPAGTTEVALTIRQFESGGQKPIRHYAVDMQMLMHLIVVRDDFGEFAHLHPVLDTAAATFEQTFSKSAGHRYYAFADSTPRGIGQQVFRFTIGRDGATGEPQPTPAPFAATPGPAAVVAGPYRVALSSTTISANRAQVAPLTVFEGGRPASDLGTYLGAAAHAVFINTATLGYVHVHPTLAGAPPMAMGTGMDMHAMGGAGPRMQMDLPPLPAGTYKLWIEFEGAGRLYTAPFTMLAR